MRHRNEPRSIRVFFPKGNIGKAVSVFNTLRPCRNPYGERAASICQNALIAQLREREPLGKTYIDPSLKRYMAPMTSRSASRSLRALTRGTRIPLPDEGGDTLRLFLWWKEGQVAGKATGRVDIDLSAALFDPQWKFLEHVFLHQLAIDQVQGRAQWRHHICTERRL